MSLVVSGRRAKRGFALIELTIAVGVLAIVMGALAVACHTDQRALRANYTRAIAIEIVDGEMETLAAGEWRAFTEGVHRYTVRADAAKNLPDGAFTLTLRGRQLRLEWLPAAPGWGGRVVREARVE